MTVDEFDNIGVTEIGAYWVDLRQMVERNASLESALAQAQARIADFERAQAAWLASPVAAKRAMREATVDWVGYEECVSLKEESARLREALLLFQANMTVPGKFLGGHFGGCTGGDPEVGVFCDQECVAARAALAADGNPKQTPAERRAQLAVKLTQKEPWYSLCVECGPNVSVDEDGCCSTCGGVAMGNWLASRRDRKQRGRGK